MNKDLLDLLACPECGSAELVLNPAAKGTLTCARCNACYPIRNSIPQMLPHSLAASLQLKETYREKLRASILHGEAEARPEPANPEVDRFMWEQELYCWGKEVIYKDSRAAEIFSSYSEKGAKRLCQFIGAKANGVEGKSLLYVGSGNDRMVTLPLEEAGAFVVNLDIAPEPLEDLMQAGAKICVCGDARRLPFRAGAFDVVFSKGSIHHSHPIDQPLQAMVGVVKSGGHIIVAEPGKHMLSRPPRVLSPSGLGYPTPYEDAISAREVVDILSNEGISQIEVAALTHAPPGFSPFIARLWESLGRAMPWLFRRFAFEFIVYGRKTMPAHAIL
ncbi:MAG: methyltransferase domain-containing protein [Dehalococcoidia bacterium]|nr:methyltransferase domain-containing protein [Dehalococcoidia bacterium]